MKMSISRRKFVKGAAAVAAMPLIFKGSLFAKNNSAPNSRLNVGIIGCGKMADGHIRGLTSLDYVRITAISDIDDTRLMFWENTISEAYKNRNVSAEKPKTYKDFRGMLADPSIDAVYIVTPDHWHAIISILAARAGKAIYCEKPMTFSIEEARRVTEAVKKSGVVFQVGSQQRSDEGFRRAAQLARNGYLGEVKEVWARLNYGLATTQNWAFEEVPPGVDWDMWCGPAPYNPYSNNLMPVINPKSDNPFSEHGFPAWRDHIDYGNSNQADFGAHHYDIGLWGLGLDGKGPKYVHVSDKGDIPGDRFGQKARQYFYETEDGVKIYKGSQKDVPYDYAVTFVGTEGIASADRGGKFWANKSWLNDMKIGDEDIVYYKSANNSHRDNFFDAVFNGSPVVAPVEGGRSSAEISIMGNIAYRLGRSLEWDWKSGKFVNDDAANRLISRPNRGEWALI